ncbi:hypothetical protein [Vibrio scophthalmi]|uniref:Uncharacterized protein n=1 Tax=Vibrio scophthalmi TaxID=45658 RepID=A0A1E3WIY0_9VIBR|nr:hypothetical protein [Vibrio scophthalmi]ODS09739.1 hypothetical protein VSF3289_03201 [Vibrio scophthalmi]
MADNVIIIKPEYGNLTMSKQNKTDRCNTYLQTLSQKDRTTLPDSDIIVLFADKSLTPELNTFKAELSKLDCFTVVHSRSRTFAGYSGNVVMISGQEPDDELVLICQGISMFERYTTCVHFNYMTQTLTDISTDTYKQIIEFNNN